MAAFVLVALLPMVLLAILNGRNARSALIQDANQALFAVASQTAASLDSFVETNLRAIHTEAELPVLRDYLLIPVAERRGTQTEAGVLALLRTLSQKDAAISSYALLDASGRIAIDTLMADIGMSKADREYFQTFAAGTRLDRAYVSPVLFHPESSMAYLYFSSPVLSGQGDFLGVLRVRYHAIVLQNLLAEQNDLAGAGSFGVLFDENHLHLAHGVAPEVNFLPIVQWPVERVQALSTLGRLPRLPENELFIMQLDDLDEHLSNPETQRFFEAEDIATGDLINQVALAEMETQPWLVAFFQPQDIFLAPVQAQTRTTLLVSAFIAIAALIVAIAMGQVLGRPVVQLSETVSQFAEGDLEARSDIVTGDEIGLLASSYNKLADQVASLLVGLEERTAALEEANLLLEQRVSERTAELLELNRSLERFVPPMLLEFLGKESIAAVQLGDQVQGLMAVMFIDIRGFTTLSEQMTPQENFTFLNDYLRKVSPLIRQQRGFVDKYLGDGLMAIFPHSAEDAIKAGIAIRQALDDFNAEQFAKGHTPVEVGIGINMGNVMLGVIGEEQRIQGTVISDAVNVASRLEGLAKQYQIGIAACQGTVMNVPDPQAYHVRFIDRVLARGRMQVMNVYEVFDGDPPEQMTLKQDTRPALESALQLYFEQQFADAVVSFEKILTYHPADRVVQIHLERARYYARHGVPGDWSGAEPLQFK